MFESIFNVADLLAEERLQMEHKLEDFNQLHKSHACKQDEELLSITQDIESETLTSTPQPPASHFGENIEIEVLWGTLLLQVCLF